MHIVLLTHIVCVCVYVCVCVCVCVYLFVESYLCDSV